MLKRRDYELASRLIVSATAETAKSCPTTIYPLDRGFGSPRTAQTVSQPTSLNEKLRLGRMEGFPIGTQGDIPALYYSLLHRRPQCPSIMAKDQPPDRFHR
jgi:hypothetical protein